MATQKPTSRLKDEEVLPEIRKLLIDKFKRFWMLKTPTSHQKIDLSKIEMQIIYELLVPEEKSDAGQR